MPTTEWNLELARRSVLRVPASTELLTLQCGSVWITQDRAPGDIVLEPGQSHAPGRGRQVLLYALAPSRVSLRTPRAGRLKVRETFGPRPPTAPALA